MARARALVVASLLAGCAAPDPAEPTAAEVGDPPWVPAPESCEAADPDEPRRLGACTTGSGAFGEWIVDDLGLPAYAYRLDQRADDRALYFNTERRDRRDHWASFGNARVTATFANEGWIEVLMQDRGPTLLNAHDEDRGAFSGGFSFVDDGEATWCTAYRFRPAGARTRRTFGAGYGEAVTEWRGVRVSRRTFAPAGDAPAVLDEVTIENLGAEARTVRHYEYWDVARRPLETNWAVSGIPFASWPADARAARDARNAEFDETPSWDPAGRVLAIRRAHAAGVKPAAKDEPSATDAWPADPFLAEVVGEATDTFVDEAAFFAGADPSAPAAVVAGAAGRGAGAWTGETRSGAGQPHALVIRSDVPLGPGESRTLRFAYGFAPMGEPPAIDPAWRDASRDLRAELAAEEKKHLVWLAADRDPALQRELAWHASQLEASVAWRDYWKAHVVPQGSAYLYLHGADGAARDLALFAVPLAFTHPSLAREELTVLMGIQRADDRRFAYAFQGHGMVDDALGLHASPSDLDLFFLWAIAEYVGATGDSGFLDAPAPFWPREALPDATTWDHVRASARHLFDDVGTGPHGFVRIGDGDWNDGIVLEAPDRAKAMTDGESVPNTQMAIAILPRVADLVAPRDAALADEIRARVAAMKGALAAAWTGSFYGRAWFGDGALAHADAPTLEAQVWALAGGEAASDADRAALVATVAQRLDDPSPAGAALAPGGQVWPAISGLLTWGYAKSGDADRAWAHLARSTMAAHAVAFPDVWYGIWSGPDGLNGPGGDRPGEAWYSQVTPMTDYPVMNANQHAMPLLAALRALGVEASADGLALALPAARPVSLATELVDLDVRADRVGGAYRPLGPRAVTIRAPAGRAIASATVNGEPVAVAAGATTVAFDVPAGASTFEARLAP